MARLQAYGFIDSFTNSLTPTIEGLQTKIKRWINAKVTLVHLSHLFTWTDRQYEM